AVGAGGNPPGERGHAGTGLHRRQAGAAGDVQLRREHRGRAGGCRGEGGRGRAEARHRRLLVQLHSQATAYLPRFRYPALLPPAAGIRRGHRLLFCRPP
ncbi:unnamed protein product, partial [Ectocarpus sp. 8 AP-2014]